MAICMYVYTYMYIYMYTHICSRTHTSLSPPPLYAVGLTRCMQVYTHMYIHTCIHTCLLLSPPLSLYVLYIHIRDNGLARFVRRANQRTLTGTGWRGASSHGNLYVGIHSYVYAQATAASQVVYIHTYIHVYIHICIYYTYIQLT